MLYFALHHYPSSSLLCACNPLTIGSDGKLSVMISIHQPNSRILELFDHIMFLGGGGMTFFGTVPESVDYFTDIGKYLRCLLSVFVYVSMCGWMCVSILLLSCFSLHVTLTLSIPLFCLSFLGFPPPAEYTPSNYFLQITDANFGTRNDFDFEGTCHSLSPIYLFLIR